MRLGSKTGTMILYVSMHGVVDGDGNPALIPPGASPLRSETWLKVSDLLERIKAKQFPDSWHKLLILDCNRMTVNWNLGLLANSFADGCRMCSRPKHIPNLVDSQFDESRPAGLVVGQFVGLGVRAFLAAGAWPGAADEPNADDPSGGGNGDRRVSLHELSGYLQNHVDGWVRKNRAERQRPELIPESAADFTIVWSLNKRAQRRLAAKRLRRPPSGRRVTARRDLDPLWQAHDRLAGYQPLRFDPLAWRDFEHKLLWLEQAATAGVAYKAPARAALKELQNYTATSSSGPRNWPSDWNDLRPAPNCSPTARRSGRRRSAHSLPLAEFFGMPMHDGAERLAAKLGRFQAAPSAAAADEMLAPSAGQSRSSAAGSNCNISA